MKESVINFSKFIGEKTIETKKSFNKEDFNDFFLPEEERINENVIEEDIEEEEINDEPLIEENFEEEEEEIIEEKEITTMENENFYPLYKDKSENFSCDVSVEGANINDTSARLIIESDDWTLMFNGDIDKNGKCVIPIKKLNLFNEGTIGKIRLEVIADNSIFVPWESDCKVILSKKVSIKMNENKSIKKPEVKKANVSVKFRR